MTDEQKLKALEWILAPLREMEIEDILDVAKRVKSQFFNVGETLEREAYVLGREKGDIPITTVPANIDATIGSVSEEEGE